MIIVVKCLKLDRFDVVILPELIYILRLDFILNGFMV